MSKTTYNYPLPKTEYKPVEICLSRIKSRFEHQINAGLLLFQDRLDYVTHDVIIGIQTQMFGETKKDSVEVEFKYPSNIWQHFKLEVFPKFLLDKFPVKYSIEIKVVDLHRNWLFPNCYNPNNSMLDHFIVKDYHQIKN